MGLCVYFHRTWSPGYNSEYIDPNLAFSYQRKLDVAKKVAWWVFVLTLLACVIILLVTLSKRSQQEKVCNQGASRVNNSASVAANSLNQSNAEHQVQAEKERLTNQDIPYDNTEAASNISDSDGGGVTSTPLDQTAQQNNTDDDNELQLKNEKEEIVEKPLDNLDIDKVQEASNANDYDGWGFGVDPLHPSNTEVRIQRKEPENRDLFVDMIEEETKQKCFVCDKRNSPSDQQCINKTLVCDSVRDCKNGRDEAFCTIVSNNLERVSMNRKNKTLEGYVLVRVKGSWHPYCSAHWTEKIGLQICKFLGFNFSTNVMTVGLDQLNRRMGAHYTGHGTSSEERNQIEDNERGHPLWLLGGDAEDNVNTSGDPIEESITAVESSSVEDHHCTVGYISCSKS